MKCPRCKTELSPNILRPDYDHFCLRCDFVPRRVEDWLRRNIEASYCPRIQEGNLTEDEFEDGECEDCVYDCLLSKDPWDMGIDSEGNCVYPEDLDDGEKEELE